MRLRHNTLSLTAQGRKPADPCTKQIRIAYHLLFLPGLFLAHFFSLFYIFIFFNFFFSLFVFLLFVLFTELDRHSNPGNCLSVQWSPAMLNRYLCRHLCMCESVCIYGMLLNVYFCIPRALVWLSCLFFCEWFRMHSIPDDCRSFRCWVIVGKVVLFLHEPRLPKFREMSPILKCKYSLSSLQVKIGIFHPP